MDMEDKLIIEETAINMVAKGRNWLDGEGYVQYLWADVVAGVLLMDGQFHDIFAIRFNTGIIGAVVTTWNEYGEYRYCLVFQDDDEVLETTDEDFDEIMRKQFSKRNATWR